MFYRLFKYRHPKRLELALWSGGELDCLAIGRPTYHGHGLRLDFLEAMIRSNDYKAFPIVLLAMEVFAAALGASELRLVHPINETMKIHYQKLGFTYGTKVTTYIGALPMTDNEKVVILDGFRKQESLSPLEQHAREAAARWLAPALLAAYDEPKSFFIGQLTDNGNFVSEEEEIDNDIKTNRQDSSTNE